MNASVIALSWPEGVRESDLPEAAHLEGIGGEPPAHGHGAQQRPYSSIPMEDIHAGVPTLPGASAHVARCSSVAIGAPGQRRPAGIVDENVEAPEPGDAMGCPRSG
jgi:hypothetical protein